MLLCYQSLWLCRFCTPSSWLCTQDVSWTFVRLLTSCWHMLLNDKSAVRSYRNISARRCGCHRIGLTLLNSIRSDVTLFLSCPSRAFATENSFVLFYVARNWISFLLSRKNKECVMLDISLCSTSFPTNLIDQSCWITVTLQLQSVHYMVSTKPPLLSF